MGRLVASVAHQIRNPLAAISQASELLGDGSGGRESLGGGPGVGHTSASAVDARLLRIIHDNVRRLDQVVSDVLMLSRRAPRQGADRVAVRLDVELPAIVARWRSEGRNQARNHGDGRPAHGDDAAHGGGVNANVVRVVADLPRPVFFDPGQLQQVLGNLLDNAWRYSSKRPGAIRLVAQALDAGTAELIVWNDGPEVAPEQQRNLFEPFYTSDAQGTGLGLFMARELCGANDAQVRYGTIALDALLERSGSWLAAPREALPQKAFVLTLGMD
jgi:two-component system sensor histidine kinase PilS (NtrC family)